MAIDTKKNLREVRFLLAPERTDIAGMIAVIAAGFSVNKASEECEQQTFFDSYDRRLLNKGFILAKCGRLYNLTSLADDSLQSSIVWKTNCLNFQPVSSLTFPCVCFMIIPMIFSLGSAKYWVLK